MRSRLTNAGYSFYWASLMGIDYEDDERAVISPFPFPFRGARGAEGDEQKYGAFRSVEFLPARSTKSTIGKGL